MSTTNRIGPNRPPDFEQFLKVLRNEVPERPVLYELYLNGELYERLAGRPAPVVPDVTDRAERNRDRRRIRNRCGGQHR